MQKNNLIIFVVTLIFVVINIFLTIFGPVNEDKFVIEEGMFRIGESLFNIEIADSDPERIKGLSGRALLPENNALLFIFENEERHGIWMKDMYFPIDIIWLDKNKKVIHIESDVSPSSFPKIFRPDFNSLYVIELNAGVVEKNKIKIGDSLEI